ncbi:MAG: hypothetical protein JOZ02_21155 [Acidobacteria bacterium]|nr:hypothetical protein [Acidobacteriota bacterium]
MTFAAYGVRVGVRVDDPCALSGVVDRLPPGWALSALPYVTRLYSLVAGGAGRSDRVRRFHLLYSGAELIARSLDAEVVYERLESDLQLYVAERAPRRVFVHAGVVGWKGQAVVIPGRSLSGKTTLVAELVRAGAVYYSDEYAVFDREGRVHPYARPLAVREVGTLRQTRRSVGEFGGRAGVVPLPVGLVVVSRFERGAGWRPRRLTTGECVLELLSNTVPARRSPARVLDTLTKAAAGANALAGPRGEAATVAQSILRSLEA